MVKTIALFSGQGSQYKGMAKSLFENSPAARNIFNTGSQVLGIDLEKLCFDTDEQILSQTINAQPAIFAHSLAAYYSAAEKGLEFEAFAGHSLGEYAALQAAGAFSVEDGFKIIKARAEAMQNAGKTASGSMAAILRVPYEEIEAACKDAKGLVVPVNLNTNEQTVISGESSAVDEVTEKISEQNKRARIMKLAVSSAFHTSMMKPSADELIKAVSHIKYLPLDKPFFSNLTGELMEITDYPKYFAQQMVSPVCFTEECKAINEYGITRAVEFGPKKVVSGLIAKNIPDIIVKNVDKAEDLDIL